jgi:hypothetical protein
MGMAGKKMPEEAKRKLSASWTPERKAAHAKEKSELPFDDRWRNQLQSALANRWERDRGKPITKDHKAALLKGSKRRWEQWRAKGKPKLAWTDRNAKRLEFDGKILTITEWSRETGIKRDTITARLKRGWSVSDALSLSVSWEKLQDRVITQEAA